MAKYDLNTITAAFTMMGRLVNAEKPVVFTKLGLNTTSCTLFKEAVTHSFKDGEGNEVLKRLFIANEDNGTYHFNTSVSPDYRTDPMLPSRIADAMAIVGRKKRKEAAERKIAAAPAVPEQPVAINYAGRPVQPKQLTDEEIELGIKEYSLSLQLLQQEKEKREAIKAKKVELLKVFSEMAKDEGFNLEDIVGIV